MLRPFREAMEREEWDTAARHAHSGVNMMLWGIVGARGSPTSANEQDIAGSYDSADPEWLSLTSAESGSDRFPALNLERRAYTKREAETAGDTLHRAVALAERLVVTYEARPASRATLPTRRYPAVGRCVYCGSTRYAASRRRLGDEHLIPEGLGGHLLLPQASCLECEKKTSGFEGWCLRRAFGPLRVHCQLPSRRPKDRPTTIPVTFDSAPGNSGWSCHVPVEFCPVEVVCPLTGPPHLLNPAGGTDGYREMRVLRLRSGDDTRARSEFLLWLHDRKSVSFPEQNALLPLVRMYAKIAHCFLVAELGLGAFKPLLLGLIDGTDTSRARTYFGDTEKGEAVKPARGHSLSREVITVGERRYHSVRVGLFPDYGMTEYQVIAGEATV